MRSTSARRGRRWLHTLYAVLVGVTGLTLLVYGLWTSPQPPDWLPLLLFAGLSLLVQRSSFHLGSPVLHSLAGVIDVAAVLALGPVPGALVAATSGVTYLGLRALRHRHRDTRHLVVLPLFNGGLKALVALASGGLYLGLAGALPLTDLDGRSLLAAALLSLAWFVLDHLAWGAWDYLEGGPAQLARFVRDAFPTALFIELLPLPFGIIVALVYTQLGSAAFGLLALVIVTVSVLVQRWAGARAALMQRVAELSTIERVGREIAQAELDVDELAQLMYDCARQVSDATIFHLGLFQGDEYTLKLWIREDKRMPEQTFQLSPGVGLVNWMRDTGRPLLVRDFAREMGSLPARPAYISEDPPRSAVYVPLLAAETVVGTLSLQSFQPDVYGEGDLRVLQAMANQAAVAMQKARAYERERKRVRQLETIGQVSRQVTATLDLDELFRRVVHLVRDNFGYYHVGIFAADPARQEVSFETSASAGESDVSFDVGWGDGLIGWAAAHAEPVIVNDVENEPRYRCVNALDETQSELVVPLLLEEELVGVLDVQSDKVDAFGPDDVFSLETLGTQVAIAVQQARLYEAERQQAWLSTALLQVADTMGQVPDMDSVLTTIVRLTPILAGVDRCAILLWDEATESFLPAQSHGLSRELRDLFEQMVFPRGAVPALDLLWLDKSPLLVATSEEGELVPQSMVETFGMHEVVFLPLMAQGELFGAMMVDYAGRSHHFGERVVGMLTGIANQAAMVLQTARLVRAQQEEAYVSMALLQVAEVVSRSTELEETLASVVRITPILVGVQMSAIWLWDAEADEFSPAEQYGLVEERASLFPTLRVEADDPVALAVLGGRPFVPIQDVDGSSAIATVVDSASALAMPLLSKGDVLGLMVVDYEDEQQRFGERWLNILGGIASQAAVAVENEHLLQEAAEQERMRQELEVAQEIQASFLPDRCPDLPGWQLAAIWRSARQVGGDFYDFIPLPPAEGRQLGLVVADVADKGVPAALFMALSRTLVRTVAIDGRSPAAAISRANELILADARQSLFVTLFYVVLEAGGGDVRYVNAGHVPPLVVRAADGPVEELRVPGIALGVLREEEYEAHSLQLGWGDVLVLYTDGVTEARCADGGMFGRKRLAEVVHAHRQAPADVIAAEVDRAVAEFVGGDVPASDDFTLLIARRAQAES